MQGNLRCGQRRGDAGNGLLWHLPDQQQTPSMALRPTTGILLPVRCNLHFVTAAVVALCSCDGASALMPRLSLVAFVRACIIPFSGKRAQHDCTANTGGAAPSSGWFEPGS